MEAVARIDLGLGEGEFWRLTPRQFNRYMKRYAEREKARWMPFRFLATVTARCAGNEDADYMEEPEEQAPSTPEERQDAFRAFLAARRAKPDGATDHYNDSGPEGTPGQDEAAGGGAGAEGPNANSRECAGTDPKESA